MRKCKMFWTLYSIARGYNISKSCLERFHYRRITMNRESENPCIISQTIPAVMRWIRKWQQFITIKIWILKWNIPAPGPELAAIVSRAPEIRNVNDLIVGLYCAYASDDGCCCCCCCYCCCCCCCCWLSLWRLEMLSVSRAVAKS